MKKFVKILLSVFCIILAVAILLTGNLFFYYPQYKSEKREILTQEIDTSNGFTVMSCNVRCISPIDFGKKSWFYRASLVIEGIENCAPAIIGFQEVTKWHYSYLCDSLPTYDSVITYRDDAFNSEGCPIFYRTDLYNLIDQGSFWLSKTPDVMSKDWGAAYNRVCGYVILEDKKTAEQFVVFNTHLDHISDEARINGIKVILDKIAEFGSLPAILMGDLNATESSLTYESATENFLDAKYETDNTMTGCTYQNWGKSLDRDCIDYVLISKTGFKVNSFRIVTDTYDGVYSSDHFPLAVNLSFE